MRTTLCVGAAAIGATIGGCLTESAVEYQEKTDTWSQAPNNQVDILWVIDDSTSMAEEQATLEAGFTSFANQLDDSGTDFQLGVITTSFDYADTMRGQLLGDPTFLTADDDYRMGFAARASVGVGGSDKEKGLEAALFALHPTMVTPGAPNAGFLRDEAQLLVVVVSDEEDCSDNGALEGQPPTACYTESDELVPVASLVSDFEQLKDDPDDVQIGAIVATARSSCPDVYVGSRYLQAAALTGGLAGDICASDWSAMLGDLGLTATGIRTRFRLTRAAQPDTLVVYVDDVEVAPSPDDGWTYDVASWFVEFHGAGIPARGTAITATYTVDPSRPEPASAEGAAERR